MQTIKEYYDDEDNLREILSSVSNPQWRVWKVVDISGRVRQNKKKINSIKRLREFIGNQPSKVYVSIAQFLQPQKVFGKNPKCSQWIIDDSLFLGSDLLFDFDSEEDISIAHKDAKKVIEHMKKESYELINIRYSGGGKGFHLLYKDLKPIKESNPIKRYERTQKKREELVERLPELKTIDIHHKRIIADQFRVHAVLNTVKAKTGHKVQEISEKDFMFLTTERLGGEYCHRLVRPIVEVSKPPQGSMIRLTPLTNTTEQERTNLSSKGQIGAEHPSPISAPFHYNFVDNVVKGIKSTIIENQVNYRYITVLKFPKEMDKLIQKTQETYKLDDFYKFLYKDIYIYINCKLVDRRRLEKIMKFSRAMNLNSFMFYKHSWIPISEAKYKEKIIYNKPKFIGIIKSNFGLNDTHSRPHANLLGIEYNNMAGKERNRICKAFTRRID